MRFDPAKIERLEVVKKRDGTYAIIPLPHGRLVRFSDYEKLAAYAMHSKNREGFLYKLWKKVIGR